MKVAVLLQKILPPFWCGMVIAVAIEAQLKFQAPGITRELGLGIGKLVFTWLNRLECATAILLAVAFFAFASAKKTRVVFGFTVIILLAQTFWLIPVLVARIDLITSGQTPPASASHIAYIIFEAAKVALLLVLSVLVNQTSAGEMER